MGKPIDYIIRMTAATEQVMHDILDRSFDFFFPVNHFFFFPLIPLWFQDFYPLFFYFLFPCCLWCNIEPTSQLIGIRTCYPKDHMISSLKADRSNTVGHPRLIACLMCNGCSYPKLPRFC